MQDTGLRAKYIHRFHVQDADGDGAVDREDILRRAERLIAGMDEPMRSPRAVAVLEAAEAYWQQLAELAGVAEDGRLTEDGYVQALERAEGQGTIAELLRPSVEAHVMLVDRDGSGSVELDEFIRSQGAAGMSSAMARDAFAALDRDGDGRVTVEEWQRAVIDYYTGADTDTAAGTGTGTDTGSDTATGTGTDAAAPGNLVLGLRD
ncbi:EF-hand domain-containing protein [Streptomyces sp. NPDC003006]